MILAILLCFSPVAFVRILITLFMKMSSYQFNNKEQINLFEILWLYITLKHFNIIVPFIL